eukprot:4803068-Amphidinium_carterae.1
MEPCRATAACADHSGCSDLESRSLQTTGSGQETYSPMLHRQSSMKETLELGIQGSWGTTLGIGCK